MDKMKNIHIEKLAINPINYINEEIIVIFDYNQRDIYENSEVFIFQDIDTIQMNLWTVLRETLIPN